MRLTGPVLPQLIQIQRRKADAFFFTRLQNAGVPGTFQLRQIGHPVKDGGPAVAVGDTGGIIAGGDGQHIFVGPAPQLGKPVDLHGAGVGGQDQFGAFQHQDAGALGKFPVEADHGPHLDNAGRCVQIGNPEPFAGGQGPLGVKVAGVHLGIGQRPAAETIEQDQGVAGSAGKALQQSDPDGHAQLPRQPAEGFHKGSVRRDGLGGPFLDGAAVYAVAIAPHLGEKGDVRPFLAGLPAGGQALLQVRFQRGAGSDLQQCDVQMRHGIYLLFAPSIPHRSPEEKPRLAPRAAPWYHKNKSMQNNKGTRYA